MPMSTGSMVAHDRPSLTRTVIPPSLHVGAAFSEALCHSYINDNDTHRITHTASLREEFGDNNGM